MNTICLHGNLVKDPVEIASGRGVELRLAFDQAGNGKTTGYVNTTVWGTKAATCTAYLHKGDQVGITGTLYYDDWIEIQEGKELK